MPLLSFAYWALLILTFSNTNHVGGTSPLDSFTEEAKSKWNKSKRILLDSELRAMSAPTKYVCMGCGY